MPSVALIEKLQSETKLGDVQWVPLNNIPTNRIIHRESKTKNHFLLLRDSVTVILHNVIPQELSSENATKFDSCPHNKIIWSRDLPVRQGTAYIHT